MVGKKAEKISRFLKNKYPWYDTYIIVLPNLRGSQKYNFHPYSLTWRARGVQNVMEIDGIFVRVKHDGFLRTVSQDAILIFVVLCLIKPLFIYLLYSYHDYYNTPLWANKILYCDAGSVITLASNRGDYSSSVTIEYFICS